MRRCALVLVVSLLAAPACGSSNPDGPTGGAVTNLHSCAGGTISGSFGATIDGTRFVATCLDVVNVTGTTIGFGATNVTQNNLSSFIDIAIAVAATAPGTFQLGHLSISNAGLTVGGSELWQAGAASNGTGSVTLTTVTAHEIAGTFSFNLVAGPNASGTKTVTNGSFDITF